MKKITLVAIIGTVFFSLTSFSQKKLNENKNSKSSPSNQESYLRPESPLNQESLDLNQALFIGETSLAFGLRNPLDGTSGGNSCSSCSH